MGVSHQSDGFGQSTVVFPHPKSPAGIERAMNGNSRVLTRRTLELDAPALNGGGPDEAPGPATGSSLHDAGEFDELYDRVLARLRRDLVVERERRGDLAGAYFRY